MSKKENNTLLIILITFSVYCALTLGETWDQKDNLIFNYTWININ